MPSRPRSQRPPERHRRTGGGKLVELGALVILCSPIILWLANRLDLPEWVKAPALWSSWFLLGLVVVAIVAYPLIRRSEIRRWKKVPARAREHGLAYAGTDPSLVARCDFAPLNVGVDPEARNVLSGQFNGCPFAGFEFFARQREKGRPMFEYWLVLVDLPARLPLLEVETRWDLSQVRGGTRPLGIAVEDEEFNRRYKVSSYDDSPAAWKYAVDILNPRAIEWLLSTEPFDWSIRGAAIVSWHVGTLDPGDAIEKITTEARVLAAVANHIPQFLWRDH